MFSLTNLLPNLFSAAASYFFYRLLQAFVPVKPAIGWKLFAFFGYWALFSVATFSNENLLVTLAFFLFFAFVTLFGYQGNAFAKITIALILYPVMLGINYLCYDLGFQLFLMNGEEPLIGERLIVFSFLLKSVIWWGIYTFFYRHIKDCLHVITNKIWGIMALVSLASFLSLISLITFTPDQAIFIYPAVLACVVTALGVIYLTGYMAKSMKIELENSQLKLQEAYYKELAHSQLEIRKLSHDMNHHLGVIATLIENGNDETLQSYFKELAVQFASYGKEFCQNSLVNAVINSKLHLIDEAQVETFINIEIDTLVNIDDVSLCALFANTMDNAIEAVLGVDNHADRKLSIQARYTQGYFSYAISNSKQHALRETANELLTTKKDQKQHGFGLKTVQGIVAKYNGTFDFSHTNEEFNLVILIGNV